MLGEFVCEMINRGVIVFVLNPRLPIKKLHSNQFISSYRSGITLVELMITIALGTLLLLSITQFFSEITQGKQRFLLRLQLQQETHRVLRLLRKDIARSGYVAQHRVKQSNIDLFQGSNPTLVTLTALSSENNNSCLLFWYDLDQSGCIGSGHGQYCQSHQRNATNHIQRELLGYRLRRGALETRIMYQSGAIQNCESAVCQSYLNQQGCNTRGWASLLDNDRYQVTQLEFQWLQKLNILQVNIQTTYRDKPEISYQSAVIIPLYHQAL